MSHRWILLADPKTRVGESPEFGSQQEAEDWMGAEWRRLLDDGALAATLMDGDDEVYTMKLTEE